AGTPPSGVALLETAAQEGTVDGLADLFAAWEIWSAEVLDSHVAYPILAYFRSSHDQTSWVSAVGAVLDAATLVLTTVEGVPRGPARFMQRVGDHLVEDVAGSLGLRADGAVGVERAEFDEARARLAAAGYRLAGADESWADFRATRASYASRINRLAAFWATPPAQWIGDRSVLRGHEREA
ncbi:MAG TPA: hypothetical protein VFK38_02655, partial [Candidatus Limnocylindrales bacterium]|nr:hypothetical protein [Candidatus Limnocylindrales bacterium]